MSSPQACPSLTLLMVFKNLQVRTLLGIVQCGENVIAYIFGNVAYTRLFVMNESSLTCLPS